MMIELFVIVGHLGNFLKTEIVSIPLLTRKYYMNETFSQLCNVGNPFVTVANTDHLFAGSTSMFPTVRYFFMK